MAPLKVKFWTGWLRSENMKEPEWLSIWVEEARKAEDQGCELVVFRIPKKLPHGADPFMIEFIEKLLQEKFSRHE